MLESNSMNCSYRAVRTQVSDGAAECDPPSFHGGHIPTPFPGLGVIGLVLEVGFLIAWAHGLPGTIDSVALSVLNSWK